jgi:hypothetical protein
MNIDSSDNSTDGQTSKRITTPRSCKHSPGAFCRHFREEMSVRDTN